MLLYIQYVTLKDCSQGASLCKGAALFEKETRAKPEHTQESSALETWPYSTEMCFLFQIVHVWGESGWGERDFNRIHLARVSKLLLQSVTKRDFDSPSFYTCLGYTISDFHHGAATWLLYASFASFKSE